MAITVNWATKVIEVPQADLTALGGSNYAWDIDAFRLTLKDLEDSETGMVFKDTHRHNTEVTLSGVIYAMFVEIINGYTVTITPAFAGKVTCTGANHNIADVLNNTTGPTLIVNNAAGLIVAETGVSGLTPTEAQQLADAYNEAAAASTAATNAAAAATTAATNAADAETAALAAETAADSASTNAAAAKVVVDMLNKLQTNRATIVDETNGSQTITIYDDDGTTPLHVHTVNIARSERLPV